ncbi:MAG: hypothetical protein U0822_08270 [Anaerolineae bacterium]
MRRERPYWVTGVAILAVIGVIVVAGVWLANWFRPQVSVEPAQPLPAAVATTAPRATQVPAAAAAPSVTPTKGRLAVANTPLEREVEAAYLNYWRVYTDAMLNLDDSHLNEVLSGDALGWVRDEVRSAKADGRPVKIDVDHAYALTRTTPTSSTVVDQYVSRSVYVDPQTKQPLPRTDPPRRVQQSFDMQKMDGMWKVVGGSREVLGEVTP